MPEWEVWHTNACVYIRDGSGGQCDADGLGCGLCPRCWSDLNLEPDPCETHDAGDGSCDTCGERVAVNVEFDCPTCPFEVRTTAAVAVTTHPSLLGCITGHGLDPFQPACIVEVQQVWSTYECEIRSESRSRSS